MHEEPHFAADDIVVKNLFNFVFPSRVFELFAQLDRFLLELGHARIGVQLQTVHVEDVMNVAIVRQVKSKTEWSWLLHYLERPKISRIELRTRPLVESVQVDALEVQPHLDSNLELGRCISSFLVGGSFHPFP